MFDSVQTINDLLELPTAEVVAIHNKVAPKPVKKFRDKATAAERTFKALRDARAVNGEAVETPKVGRKPGLGFRMAPKEGLTPILPRAKRRLIAFDAISSYGAKGAPFTEVSRALGYDVTTEIGRKQSYELIRTIQEVNGYGLWSEERDGETFIRLVSNQETYAKLEAKANG